MRPAKVVEGFSLFAADVEENLLPITVSSVLTAMKDSNAAKGGLGLGHLVTNDMIQVGKFKRRKG